MFALIAAILFAVALVLDIADVAADLRSTFTVAGLLCIALHLIWALPVFGRRPGPP